jgi:hypothetical protein
MDFSRHFSYWLAGFVGFATVSFWLVAYGLGQDPVNVLVFGKHLFAAIAGLGVILSIIGLAFTAWLDDTRWTDYARIAALYSGLATLAFWTLSPSHFDSLWFLASTLILLIASVGAAMAMPKRLVPDYQTSGFALAAFAPMFGLKLSWELGYGFAGHGDNLKGFIVGTAILAFSFWLIPRLAAQRHAGVPA